jgi:hypothetical protein
MAVRQPRGSPLPFTDAVLTEIAAAHGKSADSSVAVIRHAGGLHPTATRPSPIINKPRL